ncbi:MAG: cysteine desulfurase [Acidimicrobiaceae bacterium]|jgi:cysteine desulfurase|nr:cysteine desulfurase [Acidimicrobiaceae bacterium]MDG1088879.1 cysteine desulfurase family protein [Acidimicrobiales bacterium]
MSAPTKAPFTEAEETYLDWAASTPMRPEALAAMMQAAQDGYGNPTGAHHRARVGRRIVDDARDQVADAMGAQPSEIIFCGSGTEADNLAIFGTHAVRGGNVACSAAEHHAVLHPVEYLGGTVIGIDHVGQLDLDQLRSIANDDLAVVSVMLANNETGVVQRLEVIRAILDEHAPNALLHTDAVQAFPWLDVAELAAPADLISLSGHKFGGPKGVGVLVVRSDATIKPQILGGGQEFELRSGTHNVAGIAAFGVAAELMSNERAQVVEKVATLRDRLVNGIKQVLPDTIESARDNIGGGDDSDVAKVAGSAHVCFPGIESEALLFKLERVGIYASAASSCASGAQDPSHVLAAMGYPRELAAGSLRMSLGFGTTDADIDRALAIIPECVQTLRTASL